MRKIGSERKPSLTRSKLEITHVLIKAHFLLGIKYINNTNRWHIYLEIKYDFVKTKKYKTDEIFILFIFLIRLL